MIIVQVNISKKVEYLITGTELNFWHLVGQVKKKNWGDLSLHGLSFSAHPT